MVGGVVGDCSFGVRRGRCKSKFTVGGGGQEWFSVKPFASIGLELNDPTSDGLALNHSSETV